MSTLQATKIPTPRAGKYGITEKKKAELDAMILDVLDAQHDVDQYQAIVNCLTAKLGNFQGYLAVADGNRAKALSNKNLVHQLINNALDLENNSNIAFTEMVLANNKTKELSRKTKEVMDKLIYCADLINKLSNLVIRKKALNPLISDELVSMINTAGTDANNAVALTLVAIKSTFASQSSNIESEAATALEYTQAMQLYKIMTGTDASDTGTDDTGAAAGVKNTVVCLEALYDTAYSDAVMVYGQMESACRMTTKQLNLANTSLNKAQVKLKSLQAGLAAGNAAALAS
ncbi:MAG TPA: hypothetical protein VNY73_04360 [Bacteroidia bacterium]|nr:hypothetical protein [Bacteroidia bacterium]